MKSLTCKIHVISNPEGREEGDAVSHDNLCFGPSCCKGYF